MQYVGKRIMFFPSYNCYDWVNIDVSTIFLRVNSHVVQSVYPFSLALSLLQGCLRDILRQCRARIRRRCRVKCVSLEQIPAGRNAATRERNTFRARFPPGLSPSTAHPLRYRQSDPKTRCGSLAEGRKGHAGEGNSPNYQTELVGVA